MGTSAAEEIVTEAVQETTLGPVEIVTEAIQETTAKPEEELPEATEAAATEAAISNEIEEITTEAVAVEEVTEAREEKSLTEEVAIEEAEAFAPSVVAAPENIAVVETPAGYRYYYRY